MTARIFCIESARQIQQDFIAGKNRNVQLTAEQRRLIDNFHLTRQEINEAYAKARRKIEKDEQRL